MGIFDFLGGPLKGLIDSVGGIIDDLNTSGEEKLEARAQLLALQQDFQTKLLEADVEMAKTQASVITAEIASKSWLARNWRPILMLVYTYIILHQFVLAPTLGLPSVEIPPQMWAGLNIGTAGYLGLRTVEKTLPNSKWGARDPA